jgi:hypothetical protein
MSSGLPASRPLEQSASSTSPPSADWIRVPLACGTGSQTVLPYGSAEADNRVRGSVTAEGSTTLAAKHGGDKDMRMKDT